MFYLVEFIAPEEYIGTILLQFHSNTSAINTMVLNRLGDVYEIYNNISLAGLFLFSAINRRRGDMSWKWRRQWKWRHQFCNSFVLSGIDLIFGIVLL